MPKKISIAVIDDHPVVRRGIVDTLREVDDFRVVGEGGSADEAVTIVEQQRPELMVLDVSLPGSGLKVLPKLLAIRPELRIVMMSVLEDLATVSAALQAGASGYVSKGISGGDLVACLRRIASGERYVSPQLAAQLLVAGLRRPADTALSSSGPTQSELRLSDRERQILKLIGEGLSNNEIGARLELSENTIKHYVTPLLQKLGVRNRTEAALLAKSDKPPKR